MTVRSRPITLVFLSLTLTGCAIVTPPVNITTWPLTKQAMYFRSPAPYRLAVLPLSDQRPAQERSGQRAPALFLLLWNRRVGDYFTGDQLFKGEVATQLSRQLADYLQATNAFTEVVYVPSSPHDFIPSDSNSIRQIGQPYAADYLLGVELQHFFGSQHQHFSMLVLPLYFINSFGWQDSKGFPWGQTTIQAYLYDGATGKLVWRHRIEKSHTLPRETDSMAVAALESFAQAAGELATELRQQQSGTQ